MWTRDANDVEIHGGDRVRWSDPPHLGATEREGTVQSAVRGGWFSVLEDGTEDPILLKPLSLTVIPKVRRMSVGVFHELEYDASVEFAGITWYRVRGGLGAPRHVDREDWVADVPGVSCTVTRWHDQVGWNGLTGGCYGARSNFTRDEAMVDAIERARRSSAYSLRDLSERVTRLAEGHRRLVTADIT